MVNNSLKDLSVKRLKKLNDKDLQNLINDMRSFMISSTSETGGHIGANLSSLEATVALHRVFDSPKDKILFDVGHQAYAHKIVTGRADKFSKLNSYMGMARFVEQRESEHDVIDVSHAGTSIPIASGIAKTFVEENKNNFAIAVIGDGCIVEGMSFEGLNYSVQEKLPLLILFIDNSWAIAPNVGGVLNMTTGNDWQEKSKSFFKSLGYEYFVENDGHDILKIEAKLKKIKENPKPTVLHVKTVKGNGLKIAEEHPYRMHYSAPFNPDTGEGANPTVTGKTFAGEGAEEILKLMEEDKNLYVITPATPYSNNLDDVIKKYPNRAFDVGMAEQQAVGMAVGLALEGKKVICCFQSTFMQRAFDQIYHDAACMKLPIIFLSARTGFAGYDSPTHHGIMDISYLRCIPNLSINFPLDTIDLKNTIRDCVVNSETKKGPTVILHQYDPIEGEEKYVEDKNTTGFSKYSDGDDGIIFTLANALSKAINLKDKIKEKKKLNYSIYLIKNVKPFNSKKFKEIVMNNKSLICIEEHTLPGGLGSILSETITDLKINNNLVRIGIADKFINAGNNLECSKEADLDTDSIFKKIFK